MSLVVVGATITGAIAAILYCARRASSPPIDLDEVLVDSSVIKVDTRQQLSSLISSGGKVVVYLTASVRSRKKN